MRTTPRPVLASLLLLVATGCQRPPADTGASETPADTGAAGTPAALARAEPEDVGLSSAGLARIGPAMQALVDSGRTAGILTLVARDGQIVHWEAHGWRVLDEDPLEPDDIFRIFSMTKPVTSVAALMLIEEGRLSLDDPLSRYVPAFDRVRVYRPDGAATPPSRPITIRDLMTHTSGLTYGVFGDTPVDSLYRRADLLEQSPGRDLQATIEQLATLPLLADPGSRWIYSMSTDVLGRVVELASGLPLDAFFRTRIFEPLGMHDTGFHVPPERQSRLTTVYGPGPRGLQAVERPLGNPFTQPPHWFSGGGGLASTAGDYLRFCQMLLNEGELDGVRLLEPETVRMARQNHLPEALAPLPLLNEDHGFGLGFAVSRDSGIYWWPGAANTYFWIDPATDLIAFAWTQLLPFGAVPLNRMMRSLVYEAVQTGPVPTS